MRLGKLSKSMLQTAPGLISEQQKNAHCVKNAFLGLVKDHFHEANWTPVDTELAMAMRTRLVGIHYSLNDEQNDYVTGLYRDHVLSKSRAGEPAATDFGISAELIADYRDRLSYRGDHLVRSFIWWLFTLFGLLDPNRRYDREFGEALFRYAKTVFEYRQEDELRRHEFWIRLNGRGFELKLAMVFRRAGWSVTLTPASNDAGVDFWLETSNERTIVQCKHWSKPVGVASARELLGTMTSTKTSKGILASVSGFTAGTRSFVSGKNIQLLDLEQIVHLAST